MEKHFFNELSNILAYHNFLIKKTIEVFEGEIEDLKAEIETLEGEMEDLRAEIETLEGEKVKVKETLTLLKEIAKPGEYGSLEQRAWDIYHDLKHLVER